MRTSSPDLTAVVRSALDDDILSAALFVVGSDGSDLELAGAAGIEGPALDGLIAAVRNPAHPIRLALTDGPSFDVRPMAPGGPALRSHLPIRPSGDAAGAAIGVLAVAHERSLNAATRRRLEGLADSASVAIGRLD